MSFFSLSSSSSSPVLASVCETDEAYKKWQSTLTHLPSILATTKSTRLRGKGKSRAVKSLKDGDILSRVFNTIASRPLAAPLNRNQIYHAHLRYDLLNAFTSSTVASQYYALSVALSTFSSYTQYAGAFDQYMINEVEVWVETQFSQSAVTLNTGTLITAVDLDDATTPTTISAVEGKQSSVTSNCYDGHYHRWVPHVAIAAYSGTFTSFSNSPPCWIDIASPAVQHYGVKCAASATSASIPFNIQIRAKCSFRQAGI